MGRRLNKGFKATEDLFGSLGGHRHGFCVVLRAIKSSVDLGIRQPKQNDVLSGIRYNVLYVSGCSSCCLLSCNVIVLLWSLVS